ncbi:MAG: DUF2202 domain-containing protein [Methylocystaceae bacterium]|nr:DUF2202 domain-containing protein [Methylocystaceae bacterium]
MTDQLEAVLTEALEDEYKARATYNAVLDKFGDVRPFSNIVHAESRHASALEKLFVKYGYDIPDDTWAQNVQAPPSLLSASKVAVRAEIENAEMYDRLLAQTRDYPDVQRVLSNLQRASQQNHLPAFERALGRLSTSGTARTLNSLFGKRQNTGSNGHARGKGRGHFSGSEHAACAKAGMRGCHGGQSMGHKGGW